MKLILMFMWYGKIDENFLWWYGNNRHTLITRFSPMRNSIQLYRREHQKAYVEIRHHHHHNHHRHWPEGCMLHDLCQICVSNSVSLDSFMNENGSRWMYQQHKLFIFMSDWIMYFDVISSQLELRCRIFGRIVISD